MERLNTMSSMRAREDGPHGTRSLQTHCTPRYNRESTVIMHHRRHYENGRNTQITARQSLWLQTRMHNNIFTTLYDRDCQRCLAERSVLGVLFLDIKGTFPSIILKWLIHNMHRRGIPQEYTDWIRRKAIERETTINFNNYSTTAMEIG